MSVETVLDNEYATVWFHPDENVVHHKIKKPMPLEAFTNMLSVGADCFEQRGCQRWLSDDRANTAVPPGVAEFGEKVWSPRVIKAGFRWWAIVMPNLATGKLSMRAFIETYRTAGVTVDIFGDEKSALAWLKKVK